MESKIDLNFDLEQRKEELENVFEEDGKIIANIFYNSMKDFLDLGVELAEDLASTEED
jgi:hypothetical protein